MQGFGNGGGREEPRSTDTYDGEKLLRTDDATTRRTGRRQAIKSVYRDDHGPGMAFTGGSYPQFLDLSKSIQNLGLTLPVPSEEDA